MEQGNQWDLFGLDLRRIPQEWLAGWRELLWAPTSYGRKWFDQPVEAHFLAESKSQHYLGGKAVAPSKTELEAIIIPDALVLETKLQLPAAVELDLESLLALEVRSKSPFPEKETRYGWWLERGKEGGLVVYLAITSEPIIKQHLQQNGCQFKENLEIWVLIEERPIVINGFGERKRDLRYSRTIKQVVGGVLYSFAALCAIVAILMLFKHWQLQELEQEYTQVREQAAESIELRTTLSRYNQQAEVVSQLLQQGIKPYEQLSKLTALLGDDAWVSLVTLKGNKMRLNGRAENGSALMELLSKQPEFKEVVAVSAIGRRGRGKGEQFVFDIRLQKGKTETTQGGVE